VIPRIKFCGFTRAEDVRAAIALGVDAIGLNLARGPRKISADHARDLVRLLPPFTTAVGLFVDASESEILSAVGNARLQAVQLHGDETPELAERLRRHVSVIKAFRIATAADLAGVRGYPADAYLLDAAVTGQHGGTGVAWDWSLLKGTALGAPIILAGGLRPDSVTAAIHATTPWAVDVSSGIESAPGIKDLARMAAFVASVRTSEHAL
jgi:phosphoribosylanthranilate isomerase